MAQCVFDNVIRLSDPFKFCSYRIIFCCEQSVEECRAPLLCDKILEVWVPFNPFSVFPLPNHERKVAILDMVLSGLEILESVGYPVRFVQEGCRRFAEADVYKRQAEGGALAELQHIFAGATTAVRHQNRFLALRAAVLHVARRIYREVDELHSCSYQN